MTGMNKSVLIVGLAILCAGPAPGAPDVIWPREWAAFGPVPPGLDSGGTARPRRPGKADLLPGERLTSIPEELEINGTRYPARPLRLADCRIDLNRELGGGLPRGTTVYLLAPVTMPADGAIQIGAGADWWMQWWVDGRPVYDTLAAGNQKAPVTGRDHTFQVSLSRGEHVLAVAVVAGSGGFVFASEGPDDLKSAFIGLMAVGRKRFSPAHWSLPVDYAATRQDFRRALEAARTDAERAEAYLALGDTDGLDVWGMAPTNAPAMRRHYEAVLAMPGASPDQRARAELGIGETRLLENDCAAAREAFGRSESHAVQRGWTNTVRLAMARAFLQETNLAAASEELKRLLAEPGLDRATRFNARLHLAAIEVSPRIRPGRPRLFFNADTWPAVTARLEADPEAFQKLQRAVYSFQEFHVRDWGIAHSFKMGDTWKSYPGLMAAALVYRVTGDPALLVNIRAMLRATLDHYLRLDEYNAHVESRVCFLAALDWVWDDLPAGERDSLVRDLLRYAYGWHVQQTVTGRADHDAYYYLPAMYWYVGLATLGPELGPVDRMRALTLLGRGYDNNVAASFGRRIELMQDRGLVTRVDYAFNDLPTPAWTFLHCWRSAVGPVPDAWAFASGIAPSCVLRHMLGFKKNSYRDFGHAKSWRHRGGWQSSGLLYDNLGQFIHFFSGCQPEEAAIAAWLRERMETVGAVGSGHYPIDPYVMDLSAAPALPAGLPLARHYPANGLVMMSSGFDAADSTYALFSCGGGEVLAEHFDAGHFTIFKKGFLALDSGTRAMAEGGLDPAAGENYDRRSVAHNTLLIRMPDEEFQWAGRPIESNSGGQCRLPSAARPLAFETSRLFAYAASDLAPTYHSNKCASLTRQFLFLPPDHFVVFDRVVSTRAEYPKTWLLHAANEPAIAGREFRADQEQGRLFCRTLLPADAVLEPVGGPGGEFWADGKNWPIPSNTPYLKQLGMKDAADVPETMGRWRVEVKPGAARTDDCFLHLIQVSDQTVEAMTPSRLKDTDGQLEMSFTAGPRTYTIAWNKSGEIGGRIRIEEGGTVVAEKDLATDIRRQEGLALEE